MSNWTIQDQENSVKAAATAACFLSWLSGIWLLEQISVGCWMIRLTKPAQEQPANGGTNLV